MDGTDTVSPLVVVVGTCGLYKAASLPAIALLAPVLRRPSKRPVGLATVPYAEIGLTPLDIDPKRRSQTPSPSMAASLVVPVAPAPSMAARRLG